ncbi:MAG: integration host factor subunit alpha [Alphaproteobacteria bacterium]|jgi:integration host factor subunit alpha
MAGRKVTRAVLSKAIYQEVGLSKDEYTEMLKAVLNEISDTLAHG